MSKKTIKKEKTLEIVRSFSWKLSLPNYENRDFFASFKLSDIKESEAEKVSESLYQFAKSEVIKSVNAFLAEINKELQVADLKKKPKLWAELVKYFEEGGDKKENFIGRQTPDEKMAEESKLQDIKTELKEAETLEVTELK